MTNRKLQLRIGIPGLVLSVAVVLFATLWPTPIDRGHGDTIERILATLHAIGVPTCFGYAQLEFAANIAMFLPLGFFLSLVLPRRLWWAALLIIAASSAAIELTQLTWLLERFPTPRDVLANSIGGCVGAVIALAMRSVARSLKRSSATVDPSRSTPSRPHATPSDRGSSVRPR